MTVTAFARTGTVFGSTCTMEVTSCAECSILFAAPQAFFTKRRQDGEGFYCPNGHPLCWSETEADRQRKRAEQAERKLRSQEDTTRRWRENAERERERRSAIAYKGHLTRLRNRVANGVCPVPGCKRSGFTQVMRHIASAHPDWLHEHPELAAVQRVETGP